MPQHSFVISGPIPQICDSRSAEVNRLLEAEAEGETVTFPARKASVAYNIRKTVSEVKLSQALDV